MSFKTYFRQFSGLGFPALWAGILLIVWLPGSALAVVCGQTIAADTTLTADLVCPAGTALIIPLSTSVKLDLGGFTIDGQGTGSIGVKVNPTTISAAIINGTIRGFNTGIEVGTANTQLQETLGTSIIDVKVINCPQFGIKLGSALLTTIQVTIKDTGTAILAEDSNGSRVLDSLIRNSDIGVDVLDDDQDIDTSSGVFLVRSTVIENAKKGVQATEAAVEVDGSTITGCSTCNFGIISKLGDFSGANAPGGVLVTDTKISKFRRAGIAVSGKFLPVTVSIENTTVKMIGGAGAQTMGGIVFEGLALPEAISNQVRDVRDGFGIGVLCSALAALLNNDVGGADFDGILVQEQNLGGTCDLTLNNYGSHIIDGNLSHNNGGSGIFVFSDDVNFVKNNTTKGNFLDGIFLFDGSGHVLQGNRSGGNGQNGFQVFNVLNTTIEENRARSNGDHGFNLAIGITNTLTKNRSDNNVDWGFFTTAPVTDGGGNSAKGNGGGQCDPAHMTC